MKRVYFEKGRVVIKEAPQEKTLKQLHDIFADGTKSPKARMAAFNRETKKEADMVRKIYDFMAAADPNPDNVENILHAVKVLFERKNLSDEYGI